MKFAAAVYTNHLFEMSFAVDAHLGNAFSVLFDNTGLAK